MRLNRCHLTSIFKASSAEKHTAHRPASVIPPCWELFIPSKGSPQDTGNSSQHRDQETVETLFCNFFPHNCYISEGSSILHNILSSIWDVSDVMYTFMFMFMNLGFI